MNISNQVIHNQTTDNGDYAMNKNLVQTTNWNVGSMTQMTSREIAELTGKRHDHVKRDVEVMFKELGIDAPKFGVIYLDSMNRQRIEYTLDQELTFTLVTGYSIKLRNAVIKRWLDLENQVVSLQNELNKWCAKENCDKAIGSIHGKGLAERKKTKHLNAMTIDGILKKMQLKLEV
tara:strand:+ start:216 stop:743 length:528 start_codon:yes stop_codon:yes gene_type:complete